MARILNYTTQVDAAKTVGEVQQILAAHGAKQVIVAYKEGRPDAIAFLVSTRFGDRPFLLPARPSAVLATLKEELRKRRIQPRFVTVAQAERIAWRQIKDWVEAQLALIRTGMVTMDEVFLPYLQLNGNLTAYEALVESRLALPGPSQ
jgi:hypothetical protein